ncbi:uncharacterized protein LOC107370914 [Tetranychus urticae]|uniref:Uncharacterized protein n=1 Tax=Tetranychus urticae TaxID=32264 RepID=T1JWL2_TETUR|nr:uncharacterized protein LOC107370914 [Tetranychus urticae]
MMRKAYVTKPGMAGKESSHQPITPMDEDDYLLDDPDDDLICSQILDLPDESSGSGQPSPIEPQFKRPDPPPPLPQSPAHRSVQQFVPPPSASKGSEAMFDKLNGEIIMLRERLEIAKKQLEEEREAKQKLWDEKEAAVSELKEQYDKKLNNIQAKLDFKEHDYTQLKMKVNELERQLRMAKSQLDTQTSSKPLPYSLPIVMHRTLDFSTNKGFVDWDDSVTLNDVPD